MLLRCSVPALRHEQERAFPGGTMFHIIFYLLLRLLISPAMASEMVPEYEIRICNVAHETVVAWEERVQNVQGWRKMRLRLAPGEQRKIVLEFGESGRGNGNISQTFVGVSGRELGGMTLLHHRTFSYPAFIVEELYVRVSGEISLEERSTKSILIRVGRAGRQVLCSRSRRESELWFFFY